MPNLLIEVGTEELPASYIGPAVEGLCNSLRELCEEMGLGKVEVAPAGTPRRLCAFVRGLAGRQADAETEITGPPKHVAYAEDGSPTQAALGFAKSLGMDLADVYLKETPRGQYCAVRKSIGGRPAADIVADRLPAIIAGLPFPKSMRWGPDGIRFARPIRRVVALLDDAVVAVEVAGVRAGRTTQGHRFLHPEPLDLADADFDAYVAQLRDRKVIVIEDERRQMLRDALDAKLAPYGTEVQDETLLEEVANMVEYPTVLEGQFAERYLQLPTEVVVEAMREHQKYFSVYDGDGALQNRFLAAVDRDEAHHDSIRQGNERVLEARLADAEFFWHEDTQTSLDSKVGRLRDVLFQERLGSYFARTDRLMGLVTHIATSLDLPRETIDEATRAARLAKADLVTHMVGEFPRLQGTMGKLYALHDGEPAGVAQAIAEHYLPRHGEDELPDTIQGTLVSLADRFDAIVGLFSVGLIPTGSQDPYALRRHAQGIVRMVRSKALSLSLVETAAAVQSQMPTSHGFKKEHVDSVFTFLRDRICQTALDEGYRYDIVNAVLASGYDNINDTFARLDALTSLSEMDQWPSLVTVAERTYNLGRNCPEGLEVNPSLLAEDAERELWRVYDAHRQIILGRIDAKDYTGAALTYCKAFAEPVHVFFDQVFVNVDDTTLRDNRLAMLRDIHGLVGDRIAHLAQIVEADDR